MPLKWEIWLDTHISPAIAEWMADYTGLTVKSAYVLELHELDDIVIYRRAKDYGKVIFLSKDTDFNELISRLGSPPKLINLRIGNCDNKTLWELIKPVISQMVDLLVNTDIDIVELENGKM